MRRDRLLAEGEGLLKGIAAQIHRTLPDHIALEDLLGDGRVGLLEAADRYDPRRGATFKTFAFYRIRGAIYDGLRRSGALGRRSWAKVRAHERADAYLAEVAERDAAAATAPPAALRAAGDARDAPDGPSEDARSLADTLASLATVVLVSLEAPGGEPVADPGPLGTPADVAYENAWDEHFVREAIATLPDKERRMIEMVYFGDATIKEAGETLGLSKSWASRLHARAVDRLRDALAAAEGGRREPRRRATGGA